MVTVPALGALNDDPYASSKNRRTPSATAVGDDSAAAVTITESSLSVPSSAGAAERDRRRRQQRRTKTKSEVAAINANGDEDEEEEDVMSDVESLFGSEDEDGIFAPDPNSPTSAMLSSSASSPTSPAGAGRDGANATRETLPFPRHTAASKAKAKKGTGHAVNPSHLSATTATAAAGVATEDTDLLGDDEAVYSRLTSGIDFLAHERASKLEERRLLRKQQQHQGEGDGGGAVVGVYDSDEDLYDDDECYDEARKTNKSGGGKKGGDGAPLSGYASCLCCPATFACYQPTLRWYENYNIVPHLVVAADFIQAVGSGMTVRFLTLFFVKDYDLRPIVITVTYIVITILSALIAQIMSRVAARMQRLPLIIAVRLTGTTALFLMAVLPEIDKGNGDNFLHSIYLLLFIFVVRQACMNSTMGISRAVVMDFVRPNDRAKWSSMESFASFTWAGSAAVGGIIADASGYGATFMVTAAMHYVACSLLIPAALAGRRLERIVLAMNAKDRAAKAAKAAVEKQLRQHEKAEADRLRKLK